MKLAPFNCRLYRRLLINQKLFCPLPIQEKKKNRKTPFDGLPSSMPLKKTAARSKARGGTNSPSIALLLVTRANAKATPDHMVSYCTLSFQHVRFTSLIALVW
ncbi:hypothetical protein CDAR_367891 [Caerostris darwini]|uniref:Uncharacterized protein n=1 Tax=Caerostris darwini TaxID=1538125 RepID=A0AAV4R076_9ARAC|nr:hypothetical protein CDAR_367891 [Caerostris darwini]